jgi:hypothetical protein
MTDEDEEFNRIEREAKQRMEAVSAALREALEQPAQKCSYPYCGCNSKAWCKVERNEALDKMAENARELGLDYEPAQQEYERGFIDGMQEQMKRSVDRAVNAMAQRTWVGLTDVERRAVRNSVPYSQFMSAGEYAEHVQKATEFMLLEKNT